MPLHGFDPCWRCGDASHWASETDPATGKPKCPLTRPAANYAEHERRLQLYIDRYVENKIGLEYKRELITQEHELWRNRKARKAA